jgi:hypothetical protein
MTVALVRARDTVGEVARSSCKYPPQIDAGDVLTVQIAEARRSGGWLVAVVAVVAALAGFGGAPGPAAAQTPSYQPDSPAGSEYAIPLDEARKTGSASTGKGARSGASAKRASGAAAGGDDALFGEGVARVKKSSGSVKRSSGSASAGTPHKPSRSSAKTTGAAPAAPPATASLRPTASGVSGTAVALGTGGLVLALGAALAGAIIMSRRGGVPRSR